MLLVLETATGVSSVAVFEGPRLLAQTEYHANRLHARLVTVMVGQLLEGLSLEPADLAGVVVSRGPGSCTGLRVGVSAAKGLCMALNIPLLSVGSLELLAWSVQDMARALSARIVPMIDARRMEVFCRLFDAGGEPLTDTEAKVVEAGAFAEEMAAGPVLFVGDGAEKCRAILEAGGGIVLGGRLSTAGGIGPLIRGKFQAEDFEDLVLFEPYYLKNFVATVSKKKLI